MKATHYRLSDMVRHDLEKIAEQLPKTGQDHKANIIWWYKCRGWDGVTFYIDTVNISVASLQPSQETFLSKWSKWLNSKVSWLTGLLNRLD